MLRTLLGVLVVMLVTAGQVQASADYTAIQDIVGTYAISRWNGDPRVGGTMTIQADDAGVGIRTVGLPFASVPVPSSAVITSKENTSLTREGSYLVQTAEAETGQVRIEYRISEGQIDIFSMECDAEANCIATGYSATRGTVAGEAIDAEAFIRSVAQVYVIDLVAGHAPKDPSTADFDLETDPRQADFYAPYCGSSGACDPGYIPFVYADTSAFREVLGPDHEVVTLLLRSGDKVLRYNWETNGSSVTFRNFQYKFMDEPVMVLEHVMHKQLLKPRQ